MKVLRFFIVFLISMACGCAINYPSKAVSKARAYVLANMPELSEKAIYTVKYTPPRIFQKRILVRGGTPEDSKNDVMHTCIVWPYPDQEGMNIVVAGVSERRMDDWSPIRVVIRKMDDNELADDKDKGDFGGPSNK
ncbi:MAG TPA: hypothetical protein DET40_16165 [Lentisphaeria bacterium]|nr:MAG: hypothetical protein A2X45_22520 [Lentisphaerae bacterium GWF2_50_93]HCE45076.1 hypothetical protein [Lentisphaeria bacterium]